MEKLVITVSLTLIYYPQVNGQVESINQEISRYSTCSPIVFPTKTFLTMGRIHPKLSAFSYQPNPILYNA